MKDVAALAGVSLGTVSNVLNHPERVSGSTRTRVEQAIEMLGFSRNESARQLRAGRSRTIGVVVLDIANPFFTDVIAGIEDEVTAAGFAALLTNSAHRTDRERVYLELFEHQRVRGALLAPVGPLPERVRSMRRAGIPVVILDRASRVNDQCAVSVDDVEGGRLAVAHLLERGHLDIAVVGGRSPLPQVTERRQGAELARSGHDHLGARLLVLSSDKLDVESGRAAADHLSSLPLPERPTAVFAVNDLLAIGLLQGFTAHGLKVPDDMAIVGYDDIAFAAAAAVPLSSVSQPRRQLGATAAELLLDEIGSFEQESPHEHRQVRFTPELVVRASSHHRRTPRVSRTA
jgi:LacI family transcriptional regulator